MGNSTVCSWLSVGFSLSRRFVFWNKEKVRVINMYAGYEIRISIIYIKLANFPTKIPFKH